MPNPQSDSDANRSPVGSRLNIQSPAQVLHDFTHACDVPHRFDRVARRDLSQSERKPDSQNSVVVGCVEVTCSNLEAAPESQTESSP